MHQSHAIRDTWHDFLLTNTFLSHAKGKLNLLLPLTAEEENGGANGLPLVLEYIKKQKTAGSSSCRLKLILCINGIVGSFLGDMDIMGMALLEGCG